MSIESEISRINRAVSNAYSAVSDMGGEIPEQQDIDNLSDAIRTISIESDWSIGDVKISYSEQDGMVWAKLDGSVAPKSLQDILDGRFGYIFDVEKGELKQLPSASFSGYPGSSNISDTAKENVPAVWYKLNGTLYVGLRRKMAVTYNGSWEYGYYPFVFSIDPDGVIKGCFLCRGNGIISSTITTNQILSPNSIDSYGLSKTVVYGNSRTFCLMPNADLTGVVFSFCGSQNDYVVGQTTGDSNLSPDNAPYIINVDVTNVVNPVLVSSTQAVLGSGTYGYYLGNGVFCWGWAGTFPGDTTDKSVACYGDSYCRNSISLVSTSFPSSSKTYRMLGVMFGVIWTRALYYNSGRVGPSNIPSNFPTIPTETGYSLMDYFKISDNCCTNSYVQEYYDDSLKKQIIQKLYYHTNHNYNLNCYYDTEDLRIAIQTGCGVGTKSPLYVGVAFIKNGSIYSKTWELERSSSDETGVVDEASSGICFKKDGKYYVMSPGIGPKQTHYEVGVREIPIQKLFDEASWGSLEIGEPDFFGEYDSEVFNVLNTGATNQQILDVAVIGNTMNSKVGGREVRFNFSSALPVQEDAWIKYS